MNRFLRLMFFAAGGLFLAFILITSGLFGSDVAIVTQMDKECQEKVTGAFLATLIMITFMVIAWKLGKYFLFPTNHPFSHLVFIGFTPRTPSPYGGF